MDKEVKQKTILNKKYAMALIQKNFKLIDVQPSVKKPGEIAFIFENSDELEKEFSILLNESRIMKNMYGLTLSDIRVLIGVLQNYSIEDNLRFAVMDKLQVIDDMVCDYKAPVECNIQTDDIEIISNQLAENLKQKLNGCK